MRRWTDTDDATLLGGLTIGVTHRYIGLILSRSPESVSSRMDKLGIGGRKRVAGEWPDLPADAFKSYHVPRDYGTVAKVYARTLAGGPL